MPPAEDTQIRRFTASNCGQALLGEKLELIWMLAHSTSKHAYPVSESSCSLAVRNSPVCWRDLASGLAIRVSHAWLLHMQHFSQRASSVGVLDAAHILLVSDICACFLPSRRLAGQEKVNNLRQQHSYDWRLVRPFVAAHFDDRLC